jgi:hypothetical protein
MFWNADGVFNDKYLLPSFRAKHRIDIALNNEIHLQPTKKWSILPYTTYRTGGHRPPQGGTATAVRSSFHHNKANVPQLAALELTAVIIPTRTETNV